MTRYLVALIVATISCGGGDKQAAPDGSQPAGCQNSLECASNMVCDRSIAQCVDCVSASDCPENNDCTARKCVAFVPCSNSLDCPDTQVCNVAAGRCVACLTDADCADATQTCVANACRTKCASDRTCTPLGLLCDLSSGSCVRCLAVSDCPTGQTCQANACVQAVCVPSKTSCMLNAVATCDATGSGYIGTAVPCDPQLCMSSGTSGARCVDATPDGGTGGAAGTNGAGGTTGQGGTTGVGGGNAGTTGAGGVGGTTGAGGSGGTTGAAGTSGAAGSAGGGAAGTSGAAGVTGAGGSAGTCGNVIDDMEANTGIICQGNGRIGHWFAYNSGGSDLQTPPPGVAPTRPYLIQPPRGSSNYGMHTSGTFAKFGAIGCSLNGSTSDAVEVPRAYDVSGFTGITFFAKGTPASLQVVVQTQETVIPMYGGTCTATTCAGNRVNIALSAAGWTLYQVPFATLASGTYPFNPAHVLTINFQAQSPNTAAISADFWIDDLSFY